MCCHDRQLFGGLLEDRVGLEPTTHGLKARCSTIELAVLKRFVGSVVAIMGGVYRPRANPRQAKNVLQRFTAKTFRTIHQKSVHAPTTHGTSRSVPVKPGSKSISSSSYGYLRPVHLALRLRPLSIIGPRHLVVCNLTGHCRHPR